MNEETIKKLGRSAVRAARDTLKSLPDDANFIQGRLTLTGKEVKKKFETDPEFAAKVINRILKTKWSALQRRG